MYSAKVNIIYEFSLNHLKQFTETLDQFPIKMFKKKKKVKLSAFKQPSKKIYLHKAVNTQMSAIIINVSFTREANVFILNQVMATISLLGDRMRPIWREEKSEN